MIHFFLPGPPLLPFIGSWYCLPPICIGRDVAVWRKEYGNIIGHRIGFGKNLVIITGFEEIVAGLKHPNLQNRVSTDFQKARSFNQKLGLFNKQLLKNNNYNYLVVFIVFILTVLI